eukprot:Gb_38803 [translate_table: standard]
MERENVQESLFVALCPRQRVVEEKGRSITSEIPSQDMGVFGDTVDSIRSLNIRQVVMQVISLETYLTEWKVLVNVGEYTYNETRIVQKTLGKPSAARGNYATGSPSPSRPVPCPPSAVNDGTGEEWGSKRGPHGPHLLPHPFQGRQGIPRRRAPPRPGTFYQTR